MRSDEMKAVLCAAQRIALSVLPALSLLVGTTPVDAQGRGGALIYGERGQVQVLHPYGAISRDQTSDRVMAMIYEPLIRFDFQLDRWINVLAEDVRIDAQAVTVRLKPNVRWHDGRPLTADDVVFTFEFIRRFAVNPREQQSYAEAFSGPARKIDGLNVAFPLSGREVDPRSYLERFIIPAHRFDPQTFAPVSVEASLQRAPLGTGPYRFERFTVNGNPIMSLNEAYHGRQALLEEIAMERWTDPTTVTSQLTTTVRGRGLDLVVELPPGSYVELQQGYADIVRVKQQESYAVAALALRQRPGSPLSDVRVRRAITMALDRQTLLDTWWDGAGQVVPSPFVPAATFFDPSLEPLPYDPAQARSLINAAGAAGKRLVFIFPRQQAAGDTRVLGTVNAIADMLRQIGLTVELQALESTHYDRAYNETRNFDIAWVEWEFDPSYNVGMVFSSTQAGPGGGNSMAFSNPAVDQALVSYSRNTDPSRKRSVAATLQKLLRDEAPAAFLFSRKNLYGHKHQIVIPSEPDPFYFFSDIASWYYVR